MLLTRGKGANLQVGKLSKKKEILIDLGHYEDDRY